MSGTHDNEGFFERIYNILFGPTESTAGPTQSTPANHETPALDDGKLKLVVSQDDVLTPDMMKEIDHHSSMPIGPTVFDKAHTGDFTFMSHDNDTIALEPANQNQVNIQDHLKPFSDTAYTTAHGTNDDVLNYDPSAKDMDPEIGRILSSDTLGAAYREIHDQHPVVANDAGHNVNLDASDILSMGNNLIITGHELDCIHFQDDGWTKFNYDEPHPVGIEAKDGFTTYVHESGAIIQIDAVIQTHFDPHGNM